MKHEQTKDLVKETSRIEAFTDGVFAIAITLLVLDIHVPEATGQESLFRMMLADWETHLAFLIGFFTILVCWINHHYMFEFIHKKNGILLLFNGFKLLIVSFTPFATAVLSKYLGTEHQQTAVNLYTFNFFLMGLAMTLVWHYAYRHGLTVTDSPATDKALNTLYSLSSILSAIVFGLSFVNVWICLAMSGLMFVVFLIPKKTMLILSKKPPHLKPI